MFYTAETYRAKKIEVWQVVDTSNYDEPVRHVAFSESSALEAFGRMVYKKTINPNNVTIQSIDLHISEMMLENG